jgi:hypothetical protein
MAATRLALEVGDLLDVGSHRHAVGTEALVQLEDLRRGHAVGIPDDPGLDGGGGALDVARGEREMPRGLRDLAQRDVQPVLPEDARLLGQGQRREAGPAGQAEADLGFLGGRKRADRHEAGGQQGAEGTVHVVIPGSR